jgi:hypothetical protein
LLSSNLNTIHAQKKYSQRVSYNEVKNRGFFKIAGQYSGGMCVKEIPFFIGLHRSFYLDKRLVKGYRLTLGNKTVVALKNRAKNMKNMRELKKSLIYKIDSLTIYKKKKNRFNKNLCNFILYIKPGAYEIPKTGAKLVVPKKVYGSIYYNKKAHTKKMVVYLHSSGIKLKLPAYAKALSLGIINDMDIGIAELEYFQKSWTTKLLYVSTKRSTKRKGWIFNLSNCNRIRPYVKKLPVAH